MKLPLKRVSTCRRASNCNQVQVRSANDGSCNFCVNENLTLDYKQRVLSQAPICASKEQIILVSSCNQNDSSSAFQCRAARDINRVPPLRERAELGARYR